MVEFVEVEIGSGGVASCALCDSTTPVPDSTDAVVTRLTALASRTSSAPAPGITLVGFEPFSHPGLPEIIAAAVASGFERIRLRTDAGALTSPQNIRGAIDAGVRQLEVVMLGDGETHDRLMRRPGLHAAATQGVRGLLAAAGEAGAHVAVVGLVPVCRHNAAAAALAAGHLAALGAVAIGVDASRVGAKHRDAVLSVLETAAANGAAGYLASGEFTVPVPQARAPWSEAS